jgi:hypothetical protein
LESEIFMQDCVPGTRGPARQTGAHGFQDEVQI